MILRVFTILYTYIYIYIYIYIYVIMGGRKMCWQYYTTQNDREPLYLNYFYNNQNKNHTLMLYVPRYNQKWNNFIKSNIIQIILLLRDSSFPTNSIKIN